MTPVYFSVTLRRGSNVLINKDSISALMENGCKLFIVGDAQPFELTPISFYNLHRILASTSIIC